MKNRFYLFLLICLLVLPSFSPNNVDATGADPLARLNWSDKNYKVLNQLIKDYGSGGKLYDEHKAPYAVFDWDQTCAHFDVEEAMMRYQMFHLRYRMGKSEFAGLLKDNINGITQLSNAFNHLSLASINHDLINDYNFLYDHFMGSSGTMTLEEIQKTPQYQDFVAKIPFLYDGYCATQGIGDDYGYPWVLYLFAGHTIDGVKSMAREAISYELSNRLSKQTLKSPANLPTDAGIVSYSYKSGLRVFPEIQNLIAAFKNHGIDVFIVSASYKPVVEVFSGIGNFGYNVSPDHVIGMELNTDKDGKILPEYKSGWVKTFRQGKVEAINRKIKSELHKNQDPLFSASDSDGDYEMCTKFHDMKLSLIWNRLKGGDIGSLCIQAVHQVNNTTPRFILQGRNENTGIMIPCSETVLFGETERKLLP